MALAASLLHENIIAANPITVLSSIFRLGVAYLRPCLVASITLTLSGLGVWGLLYKLPSMWMEALALWAYWLLTLYGAMVTLRMMGLTYHAHALDLSWFRAGRGGRRRGITAIFTLILDCQESRPRGVRLLSRGPMRSIRPDDAQVPRIISSIRSTLRGETPKAAAI